MQSLLAGPALGRFNRFGRVGPRALRGPAPQIWRKLLSSAEMVKIPLYAAWLITGKIIGKDVGVTKLAFGGPGGQAMTQWVSKEILNTD